MNPDGQVLLHRFGGEGGLPFVSMLPLANKMTQICVFSEGHLLGPGLRLLSYKFATNRSHNLRTHPSGSAVTDVIQELGPSCSYVMQ